MTSDPDEVLNAFDMQSETLFLLQYTLQLFLAMEEGVTRSAYDVSDEKVLHLCAAPARLPPALRDFILWQRNILKLDDREIIDTHMPRGLQKKYAVKGARLAEMSDDAEREAMIKECIAEQAEYLEKFNEVRAILEATQDRFRTVEDTILRAESLDSGLEKSLFDQKKAMDDMLLEITELRAGLEDTHLPDLIKFDATPQKAWQLMKRLSNVNLKARDAMRIHRLESGDDEE